MMMYNLAIIFLLTAACLIFAAHPRWPKSKTRIRPEYQLLIDLILLDRDWQKGAHTIYHASGVNVWIGNPDIDYWVKWGSKGLMDYDCNNDATRTNATERKAMKAALAGQGNDSVREVANRITEMYKNLC